MEENKKPLLERDIRDIVDSMRAAYTQDNPVYATSYMAVISPSFAEKEYNLFASHKRRRDYMKRDARRRERIRKQRKKGWLGKEAMRDLLTGNQGMMGVITGVRFIEDGS